MDSVGKLLQHAGPDQEVHTAALVISVMNDVLQKSIGVLPRDARAMSYQQGVIRIQASHGAVAGMLNQQTTKILEDSNRALARINMGRNRIERFEIRVMELPTQ